MRERGNGGSPAVGRMWQREAIAGEERGKRRKKRFRVCDLYAFAVRRESDFGNPEWAYGSPNTIGLFIYVCKTG